ncbi:hypothetical protein D9M71_502800 [compost metagenome]
MPNVRASSGMIGTILFPNSLSRMRSLSRRTNAMVVAASCLPEPRLATSYTLSSGRVTSVCLERRSGTKPPRARRRSMRYWISGESMPGW